jgi:hypothetical protein
MLALCGSDDIAARHANLKKRGTTQATRGVAPQQTGAKRCARNFQKAYTFLTDFTRLKHQA